MSFRFFRRFKIAPGLTLNLSKAGASVSTGPRGAKATVGSRGSRGTVGLPGTGLFYTTHSESGKRKRRAAPRERESIVSVHDRLDLGFFKRLVTPDDEEALVDACRELVLNREDRALTHLREASHLADGAYLAGFLSIQKKRWTDAHRFLTAAATKAHALGNYFNRYGLSATFTLTITPEVMAHIEPNLRGVLLGLAEVCQVLNRRDEAIEALQRLRQVDPGDVVVRLSLAELRWESRSGDPQTCRDIIELSEFVENESPVHAALLLYKARALRELGLPEGARDVLTRTLRRKKDRPRELWLALRYERARAYTDLGQEKRARKDLEKIFADDPDYEDVAQRLGV